MTGDMETPMNNLCESEDINLSCLAAFDVLLDRALCHFVAFFGLLFFVEIDRSQEGKETLLPIIAATLFPAALLPLP